MRIMAQGHPEAMKYMAKGVIVAAVAVLLFQIITTGQFFSAVRDDPNPALFVFGCMLGFVIAMLEYVTIEALRNQWGAAMADKQLTISEKALLSVLILLLGTVCLADVYSTSTGAIALGFSPDVGWTWGFGQLFVFEYLFTMYFHLKDKANESRG